MAAVHDPHRHRLDLLREVVTMSLYISMSLLALLAALPSSSEEGRVSLSATMALTAIGLVLAHEVSFRLSDRLVVRDGELTPRMLGAQALGGGIGTAVAVVPTLIFGKVGITEGFLFAFVVGTAIVVGRRSGRSWARSITYATLIAVVVLGVLLVKGLVDH